MRIPVSSIKFFVLSPFVVGDMGHGLGGPLVKRLRF